MMFDFSDYFYMYIDSDLMYRVRHLFIILYFLLFFIFFFLFDCIFCVCVLTTVPCVRFP